MKYNAKSAGIGRCQEIDARYWMLDARYWILDLSISDLEFWIADCNTGFRVPSSWRPGG